MKTHTTKDGKVIPLNELSTEHLKNIIKWIERRSVEGLKVVICGGDDAASMFYDEYELYGKKVLKRMHYQDYVDELKNRSLKASTV